MLYAHCYLSGRKQLVVIEKVISKVSILIRRTFHDYPVGDPIRRHIQKHGLVIHGENIIRNDWIKKLPVLLICFISAFISCVEHNEKNAYIQQSYVDPRVSIIQKNGDTKGTLEESVIDSRKTIRKDKGGNIKGYYQKSYIDPRKTVFQKKK